MIKIGDVEYKKIFIAFNFIDNIPTDVEIELYPLLGFKGEDIDITLSDTNIVKIMGINRTNLTYFVFEKEINCINNNVKVAVKEKIFDEKKGELYVKLSKQELPSIKNPSTTMLLDEVRDQQNTSSSRKINDESGPKKQIMFKETILVVVAKFSSLLKCIGLSLRNALHSN
ncbi:unnamed protein product [Cuscuta epithymum]|uniref:Uncharacterized protein n=1 Tax=Cuscuta epithymum TaxID=186058 RepID=A0AAV0FXC6_9ASTE|nr:unnamed protein product [Cuscuta epithymum]